MKKTLIRAFSFLLTLSLLTGLLCPFASALEYEGVPPISIESTASLLVDMDTDQILHEENADEIRYPASITKVMTALLTLEAVGRGELTMDTMVTVPAEALKDITDDSSTANIVAGEQISVHDLLYCLLVVSANEAANILAITVSGDIPTFVDLMNQRAQELGMENTHFVNPHGLHHADHYTTARDIYTMAKEAMTHAPFREIVSTGQYTTAATNKSEPRTLYNTNGLLARFKYAGYVYSGTIGIKTGSTPEAGYCLVAAAKKKGVTLISVVLGCENIELGNNKVERKQFSESSRLLDWGFTNFSSATLLNAETYLEEVPVRNSFQSAHVVIQPEETVKSLIPGQYDPEKLDLRLTLNSDTAYAPISKGDALGKVAVIYDGEQYAEVDMVAVSDVSFSPFSAFISSVDAVLGNLFVRILLALALLFFLVGVVRRFQAQKREELKEKRLHRKEEKRQAAEARHLREEAAYAQRKQDQERKRQERDRAREEEQAFRRAEQERRRQEQEARRAEEARLRAERERVRAEEQAIRRAEQEKRRRERERIHQEELAARRAEQERRRREQERRRQQAEERRWQEQTRREFYDNRDPRGGYRQDYREDRRPTARDDRRGSHPSQNKRDRRPNNRR
ncbi:MAG: serine hydrolase [Bacillota bacterium]|nr:serine hydrolase [Bacillota bacterium]